VTLQAEKLVTNFICQNLSKFIAVSVSYNSQ